MGTTGANFLPGLHTDTFQAIWRKGFDPNYEAYALTAQHPAFPKLLRDSGVATVVICGIAINICCYFVAKDLRQAGFDVWMVVDASAGIDIPAANLYQAVARAEAESMGIKYVRTAEVIAATGGTS
jgi:nicotinamidase/pyrazinamidase